MESDWPPILRHELQRIEDSLVAEFSPSIPADVVRSHLEAAVSSWENAPIRQFVPIFVERTVREALRKRPTSPVGANECP